MSKITTIICTYNPNIVRLNKVLDALKNQTLEQDSWELIIVNNNSTINFESNIDISWHPHSKIVNEPNPGLTHARVKGISEAKGDLIVFVDDDNLLGPNYLMDAEKIMLSCPFLGVWGANINPEFEIEPEEWTQPYWKYLAIKPIEKDYWANDISCYLAEPCGAGLCVRSEVAQQYIKELNKSPERKSLDRRKDELISGGDTDIVLTALSMNYGMGVYKKLILTHIIPPNRLTENYLLKLTEGLIYSHKILSYLRKKQDNLFAKKNLRFYLRHYTNLILMSKRDKKFYHVKLIAEEKARNFIKKNF